MVNDSSNRSKRVSEIAVPRQTAILSASVGWSLLVGLVALAIWNLIAGASWLAAVVALLLVGWGFRIGLSDGLTPALTSLLDAYSNRHFVRCATSDDAGSRFEVGYRLSGGDWLHLGVRREQIESVEWTTGQASYLAGKEVNDWHVTIWYDHDGKPDCPPVEGLRKPDQNPYCISVGGMRDVTESFGRSVVALLRENGYALRPAEAGNGYERARPT